MDTYENRIDTVRQYFEDHKAERYPFENQMLAEHDEYVKSLYFRMLCALIRYTGEPDEMQVLYIRRLIAGCNTEQGFTDYMRMALEIDIKDVEDFISVFQEDELRYYFCIDGTILLSVVEVKQKNYELLAELIEMLKISSTELTYLTAISKAIIMQNTELYDVARELTPDTTEKLSLFHYVQGFYSGMLSDTPLKIHVYAPDKSTWNSEAWDIPKTIYTAQTVIIENFQGTLQSDIGFCDCSCVILKNCNFIGNQYHFEFDNVGSVYVEDCIIGGFTNRFAVFNGINNLSISRNVFLYCGYEGSGDIRGGVIGVSRGNIETLIFEENEINNCYISCSSYRSNYGCTAVFYAEEYGVRVKSIEVRDNKFSGCQCKNNGNYTEAYIHSRAGERIDENNVLSGNITRLFEN